MNRKKDNGMQIYYKNQKYIFAGDPVDLESYKFVFGKEQYHLKISIDTKRGIYAEMSQDNLNFYDKISFNMLDERLTKTAILMAVLRI
jgi:hypothetical protein